MGIPWGRIPWGGGGRGRARRMGAREHLLPKRQPGRGRPGPGVKKKKKNARSSHPHPNANKGERDWRRERVRTLMGVTPFLGGSPPQAWRRLDPGFRPPSAYYGLWSTDMGGGCGRAAGGKPRRWRPQAVQLWPECVRSWAAQKGRARACWAAGAHPERIPRPHSPPRWLTECPCKPEHGWSGAGRARGPSHGGRCKGEECDRRTLRQE